MANPITLQDLSPRQVTNLKRIADGHNADTEIWCQLFDMDLVNAEYDDAHIMRDVLTEAGQTVLAEIKAVQS